jgi:hypothetical protein
VRTRPPWLALAAALALAACGSSSPVVGAPDGGDGGDAGLAAERAEAGGQAPGDRLETGAGDARDAGYATDGPCTPGVPRCHGDFGYQMCEQNGTWSESHSCAGYSTNGTSSYCSEIPMDTGDTWATCVDPACWYWLRRGTPAGATAVGICQPDGMINRCSSGGTLSLAACDGVCTRVTTLDARPLGYCAPACADGARECLGGPFYRKCSGGRWSDEPAACDGDCNPVATGTVPDIRCGGKCDPGTSRCSHTVAGVDVCTPEGTWVADRTCLLGRCRPAGPQAQCEAECAEGQRDCAFDGAGAERRCEAGRWTAEMTCAAGTSCRLSADLPLGCVACVGARPGGGNAFGAADRRCGTAGVDVCGADNAWHLDEIPCPDGKACTSFQRGPSSLAACQPL